MDSEQHVGTMLAEKLSRIAQIEEDWHKIDDGCSDNDTQYSTPVKSDESQGSSGLEQSEVATTSGSNENLQHDKSFTPDPRTAADQVRIPCDEESVSHYKRELDENGNLIPLPPVTPPLEASISQILPSSSADEVIDFCAPAAASSSDPTVNPGPFGGNPVSTTHQPWSAKESPRRPHRISKAWKAAGVAGMSLGVEDIPQDTQVIEGIVNGPSEYATEDASCENRQTENRSGCAEIAGLGSSNAFDKPGNGAENEVPRADDMVKGGGGIESDEDLDAEDATMDTQYLRDFSIDIEQKPSDMAGSEVPKTDNIVQEHNAIESNKGLDGENGKMEPQHPAEDIPDKEEKSADAAGSDVPTTDNLYKEHGDVKSARDLDIKSGDMEAQQPGEDGSDTEKKAGDGVVHDVLVKEVVSEGHDSTYSDEGSHFENEETQVQHHGKVDIANATDLVRNFASRGLALLMVAKGFDEQEEVGEGQTAVEHPVDKKVNMRAGCNQCFTERGLALLMETMDGSLGI